MAGEPLSKAAQYSTPGAARAERLVVPREAAGLRLDQALARLLPRYSRSRLAAWIRDGCVQVDGRAASPKDKVRGGELIELAPAQDPAVTAFAPEPIPLAIVYEDDQLLVLDKPPGRVVHPGSGNWQGTLLNALLHRCPALAAVPRAGIVHRLDKDTSGLMVVAKTLSAHASLVRQLAARDVRREYLALVQGDVNRGGTVDAPVGRHPTQRTRMAVVARGKPALTRYEVLERFGPCTLLRCRLETGRTHQIRVHLTSIGHPLVGDPVYRRNAALPAPCRAFRRQALHATTLAFVHPQSGRTLRFDAPPPSDLAELLAALRDDRSAA
ncbi:MAG: 23S rRNA pseudouridine(1911/1915/1917) synthase RluD [Pseudomonadota bacterium]